MKRLKSAAALREETPTSKQPQGSTSGQFRPGVFLWPPPLPAARQYPALFGGQAFAPQIRVPSYVRYRRTKLHLLRLKGGLFFCTDAFLRRIHFILFLAYQLSFSDEPLFWSGRRSLMARINDTGNSTRKSKTLYQCKQGSIKSERIDDFGDAAAFVGCVRGCRIAGAESNCRDTQGNRCDSVCAEIPITV